MRANIARYLLNALGLRIVRFVRRFLELKPQHITVDHLRDHVIVVNNIGMPVPLTHGDGIPWFARHRWLHWVKPEHLHPPEFNRHQLDHIMRRIRAEHNKVAIIIHGGLNNPHRSVEQSVDVIEAIGKEFYPIIIVWDSWWYALWEAWWLVRSGHYSPWAPLTAPFMICGDFIRGLAFLLMSLPAQIRAWYEGSPWRGDADDPGLRIAERVRRRRPNVDIPPSSYTALKPLPLSSVVRGVLYAMGSPWPPAAPAPGLRNTLAFVARLVLYAIQFVPRVLTSYLVCVASPRTWPCMRRRAQSMFRAPEEFEALVAAPERVPSSLHFSAAQGAMAVLADRLKREFGGDDGEPEVRVTLIAHSMGSVIANEFIRYAGAGIAYDDIVYLAPACSVRDWADSVMPVLERDGRTNAYVSTLHPKREVNEQWCWGFFPRGSILEWLERFLDPPHSHLDRVLGKFDNVVRSLHVVPAGVRCRVHIKAFPYDGNHPTPPYRHTHFLRVESGLFWWKKVEIPAFWRRAYWT